MSFRASQSGLVLPRKGLRNVKETFVEERSERHEGYGQVY